MKPKIIAIYGKANSGKTTTIKEISSRIKTKYKPSIEQVGDLGKDILEILKWNNFTIGICSQGDSPKHLKDNIPLLEKYKPDMIICATRTRGGTCQYIESKKNIYDIEWIKIPFSKKKTTEAKEDTVLNVMDFISDAYNKKNMK